MARVAPASQRAREEPPAEPVLKQRASMTAGYFFTYFLTSLGPTSAP